MFKKIVLVKIIYCISGKIYLLCLNHNLFRHCLSHSLGDVDHFCIAPLQCHPKRQQILQINAAKIEVITL